MKIGELSKHTNISIHTIRYYEKQGLIRAPIKDHSGHRTYTLKDVELLDWVTCMKHSGMSLNTIKRYTHAFYDADHQACIHFLQQHLDKLTQQHSDITHYIDVTERKIARFKKMSS